MEALTQLRAACRADAVPAMPSDGSSQVVLNGSLFSLDAPTAWLSSGADHAPYPLGSLLLLWHMRDRNHPDYILSARAAGMAFVARPDRKPLLDYLEGKAEPPPAALAADAGPAAPAGAAAAAGTAAPAAGPVDEAAAGAAATGALSAEKIAELRAKRAKRQTAAEPDGAAGVPAGSAAGVDGMAGIALRAEPGSAALAKQIMEREVVLQTHNSVLTVRGKNFEAVLKLLTTARRGGAGDRAHGAGGSRGSGTVSGAGGGRGGAAAPGYERYQQPGQREETGKFDINFRHTYMPGTIFSEEAQQQLLKQQQQSQAVNKPRKRTSRTPIILVPAGTTSLITMYNVVNFLQTGTYETYQEVMARGGDVRQKVATIQRKPKNGGTATVAYKVTDSVGDLAPEDWDRVVAVFVAGPAWQFTDWPEIRAGKKPADLFAKYKAFHMCTNRQKAHPNALAWSCELLELSLSKRHQQSSVMHTFWESLDKWNAAHHPELRTG